MAYVNLSSMPSRHKIQAYDFPSMDGGLNLQKAPINLNPNESPEIENLWWEDGVLQSRPGQEWADSGVRNPVVASGDCGADGNNVTWELYVNGALIISGAGAMADYDFDNTYNPWGDKSYAPPDYNIQSIWIKSGITHVGDYAFDRLFDCKSIYISQTVTSIGTRAFSDIHDLQRIVIPASISSVGSSAFSRTGADYDWRAYHGVYYGKVTDVYYTGTEEQFNEIKDSLGPIAQIPLFHIHYNSTGNEIGTAPSTYILGWNGYAATTEPFYGRIFFHQGTALYSLFGDAQEPVDGIYTPKIIADGIPKNAGTFFRFDEYLFYKNRGGFFRIAYNGSSATDGFSVSSVTENSFVPTIVINADPATGSGTLYQPENRLSPKKRVIYTANAEEVTVTRTGNGTRRAFLLGENGATDGGNETSLTAAQLARLQTVKNVFVGNAFTESALYTFDKSTGSVIFNSPPEDGTAITITVNVGNLDYHLPVEYVDEISEVRVDNLVMREGSDYTVDLYGGVVTFLKAPPVTNPPTTNTVEIVYSKRNTTALNAVMDCPYCAVYGSGTQLCIVAAGSESQPNAVFWTGHAVQWNDGMGDSGPVLNPSYWPMTYYNLVGDFQDPVTGFGKQYSQLIVFKKRSVGKLNSSVETIDGRDNLSLTYERVNDRIGCWCPGSIQLIENNLVFCDKSGVYMLRSASAAYENNVLCISGKVNGSRERPGLLLDLETAGDGPVSSLDDGRRYWLAVNGHVWVWDYELSTAENPVWFYFTGIATPAAWFLADGSTYHLNTAGRVTKLGRTFTDYGAAIPKVYQFPVRNFGSYDRLKDVLDVLFSTRADVKSNTTVIYETDYENRADRVNIATEGYDRLSERDLTIRDLSVPRYAATFRRKPMCRHVRHFALRLENREAGCDLSLFFVQVQIRFLGKDR